MCCFLCIRQCQCNQEDCWNPVESHLGNGRSIHRLGDLKCSHNRRNAPSSHTNLCISAYSPHYHHSNCRSSLFSWLNRIRFRAYILRVANSQYNNHTTSNFIRLISTIVLAVASQCGVNALSICALELIRRAIPVFGERRTHGQMLV